MSLRFPTGALPRKAQIDVTVASNGLEALEKVRKVARTDGAKEGQMFDCVLMDLEMPVMDGLTSLRHIRAEEAEGKLAQNLVIALSKCLHSKRPFILSRFALQSP